MILEGLEQMSDKTFKMKILNYQRVRNATLEFIPGLNVIVGESNQGKSCVGVRAPETAIFNIPREEHITLGETKSAVGIQYNGHEVIWRRDTESASQVTYRVDGKIYQKLGRGQPEEVAKALGISELEINDKKYRLNFSRQMTYPFLLDATPADMFKFIAQSSGEDNLVDVLKQMKKDVNEIASKVKAHEESQKVLGETLVQLEKKYKEIKDKKQYCDEVIDLDSKVKQCQDIRDKLDTYLKCKNALEKMDNSLNYLKRIYNEVSSAVSVSESHLKVLTEVNSLISQMYQKQELLIRLDLDLSKYKSIQEKYSELDSFYNQYKDQDANRIKFNDITRSLDNYNTLLETRNNLMEERDTLQSKLERYDKFSEAIGKVLDMKSVKEEELANLRDSLSRHSGYQLEVQSYSFEIPVLIKEVDELTTEISSIGVCPYCGSVLEGGSHEHK